MAEQAAAPPVETAQTASAPPAPAEKTYRVPAEEYMERYAHDFYEWVKGEVVKMTPVSFQHDELTAYLLVLLKAYFALRPIGVVKQSPFVMRVDETESRREPDLQVILESNPGALTDTAMVGPADICIEVVSPESAARDRGEKFIEYEKGGVREYWIIDPIRSEALFLRLGEQKVYTTVLMGREGQYQTPLLPGLVVEVGLLWEEKLPDVIAVVRSVEQMVGK